MIRREVRAPVNDEQLACPGAGIAVSRSVLIIQGKCSSERHQVTLDGGYEAL